MKRIITALLLVFALVGYIGLTGSLAVTSSTMKCGYKDCTTCDMPPSASANTNSVPTGIDFGAGDRWSPYPPYHHNDQ
ncbi:MAG: hypothetical protein ABSE08_00235 [Syntrophobacteraceae bacterium]|jgi:hypothetical protein